MVGDKFVLIPMTLNRPPGTFSRSRERRNFPASGGEREDSREPRRIEVRFEPVIRRPRQQRGMALPEPVHQVAQQAVVVLGRPEDGPFPNAGQFQEVGVVMFFERPAVMTPWRGVRANIGQGFQDPGQIGLPQGGPLVVELDGENDFGRLIGGLADFEAGLVRQQVVEQGPQPKGGIGVRAAAQPPPGREGEFVRVCCSSFRLSGRFQIAFNCAAPGSLEMRFAPNH